MLNGHISAEFEEEIRSRINPLYADVKGTESYERKRLICEIDLLREELHMAQDNCIPEYDSLRGSMGA
jgi:hypothetical protein